VTSFSSVPPWTRFPYSIRKREKVSRRVRKSPLLQTSSCLAGMVQATKKPIDVRRVYCAAYLSGNLWSANYHVSHFDGRLIAQGVGSILDGALPFRLTLCFEEAIFVATFKRF
jgi:hypothetical protein